MVTKEEFGQFVAEVESFRDMILEELTKLKADVEDLKETMNDLVKETKVNGKRKIG